ncbi:MAG: hypothetical protein ACI81R_001260 [Bradymonadia bacterium]
MTKAAIERVGLISLGLISLGLISLGHIAVGSRVRTSVGTALLTSGARDVGVLAERFEPINKQRGRRRG